MAKTPEEKVVAKLTKLGVTDLTGQETLEELEARLEVAKATVEPKTPEEKVEVTSAPERPFQATGRFESVRKGDAVLVYNEVGQLVGNFDGPDIAENERKAGDFAMRSNKLVGK